MAGPRDTAELVEFVRMGGLPFGCACLAVAGRVWRRGACPAPTGWDGLRGALLTAGARQADADAREARALTPRARLLVVAWRTGGPASQAFLANWRPAHEHAGFVYSLMLVEWPRTRERPPLAVRQAMAHGFHPEAPYGVCPLRPYRPRWPYRPPAQKRRI
jgi:hypothetical protein